MKYIFTLCIGTLCCVLNCYSQIDTSGGRYWDAIFPAFTLTSDVVYGSNTDFQGTTQTLLMDIYEPQGDTVLQRPLIIFAHGGSFEFGSKTDGDVSSLCKRFAKRGYVTASIDYRLGMSAFDSVNTIKAFLRASQDMKAAVRFFRQDAAGVNTYRIHPGYLFAGGSSAGAILALHLAYLDKVSEFPLGATELNSMGGLEGNSGNAGYPSNPLAVINLCGALGDSSYLEPGDIPFVSMHGTNDTVVPYGSGLITVLIFQILHVDGSASIHARANNIGVQNPFYTWYGAGHVPYSGGSAQEIAYMDTTVDFVKAFLRPFLGLPVPSSIEKHDRQNEITIFPNPSQGSFTITATNFNKHLTVSIFDVTGRKADTFEILSSKTNYSNLNLRQGIYFLKITDGSGNLSVKKILVE
jgi:poly(3-hydroxybutyrate) depolymerase